MADGNEVRVAQASRDRQEAMLEYYGIGLSVLMMLLGLRHWAIILGLIGGVGGSFEAMSAAWKVATMHMGVVDLVASVGLWTRAAWGRVMWVYAAISEIALHTVFIGTFGGDPFIVALHGAALIGFFALIVMSRRQPQE